MLPLHAVSIWFANQMAMLGLVTEVEMTESKRRKHTVESANFDGDTPVWARQLQNQIQAQGRQMNDMALQIQGIQQQVQPIQGIQQQVQPIQGIQQQVQRIQGIQNTIGRISGFLYRHDQEIDRGKNRSRRVATDPIVPLINLEGLKPIDALPAPIWFPGNDEEFCNTSIHQIRLLLDFYGLARGGDHNAKRRRVSSFLGLSLPRPVELP